MLLLLSSPVLTASIHAPAAFLISDALSDESMLGQALGPSPHPISTVAALSEAVSVSRLDWQCLEDVDVIVTTPALAVCRY